jgi:flagellar hook-associated protein 3 FlgL
MINRVASSAGARTMLDSLMTANRGLVASQEQVTTGRRINRMSDAPGDAVSAINQRSNLRRLEQFQRNAEEGKSWLDTADSALIGVNTDLSNVRALLVQANSPASDSASRAAIASQIRALRASILQSANTDRGGRLLFSGTAAGTAAYDANGVYQGNTGVVTMPVSGTTSVQVNQTGPDVFGTPNAADPLNGDLFQVLDALATAVSSGDTGTMTSGLTLIDNATNRVSQAQVLIGSRAAQIDDVINSLEDRQVTAKDSLNSLENVDMAQSIVEMKTREAAYQAAIQVTAKVVQPTLLDFLR